MFEAEGYSSLWSAHTIGRSGMLTDPLIALAVAAVATSSVDVGTAVLQAPLFTPLDIAHRVISLHQICGDRLNLGIGAGSTKDDFEAMGKDYGARFKTLNTMADMFRDLYKREGLAGQLKPWKNINTPPKLLLGSWGAGVENAARNYDGWIASAHYRSMEELENAAARYAQAGGTKSVVSTIVLDGDTDLGELKERLERYKAAGFGEAVIMLFPGAPSAKDVRKLIA
jgi:alkanesulfonate monooxygenase SsuD/methylene tetrahydromethanopterin reductase-like flavin-dependent oxidoreductase (luciferase family)